MAETNAERKARLMKDWTEQLSFCDETMLDPKAIVDILTRGVFPASAGEVFRERYRKMRQNAANPCGDADWQQGDLTVADMKKFQDALLMVPRTEFKDPQFCRQVFDGHNNIGHDLPTWMCFKGDFKERQRIMIVSVDPLRNNHAEKDMLFVSTPFGLHSCDYIIKKGLRNRVWRFLNTYLRKGAVVYFTDFKKLYCKDSQEKAVRTDRNMTQKYAACLQNEIFLFQPDKIMTLGKAAAEILTGNGELNAVKKLLPQFGSDSLKVYTKYHTNARGSRPDEYYCVL